MPAPFTLFTAAASSLFAVAYAQNSSITPSASGAPTSTYSQKDVPTGVPIAGKYNQPLRPQVHFSPPQAFLNDPNGMFLDAEGVYHLYYQYNPIANIAGTQHWSHATTKDLYTWTNQPIAIFPGGPTEGIFSGSIVIDTNNTSGFFPGQDNGVVAIYTVNTPEQQTQDIAYSHDNGISFIKYANNPIIKPGGTHSNQFRDPKVIWYAPTESWVMVVAYPIDFKIGIFTSPNLKDWTPTSNFSNHGLTGLQYECPNMVEIPVEGAKEGDEPKYLMLISINPGAPLGGSIAEYFVGTFNGTHFEAEDSKTRLTDFAKDNYAGQFFYGIPSDKHQITIDWASNWQYTNEVPTAGKEVGDGFRGVMTVPRGHYLKRLPRQGLALISYPVNIKSIAEKELAYEKSLGDGTVFVDYSSVKSGAIYFEANVTGLTTGDSLDGTISFTFSSSKSGESVTGGTSLSSGDIWLDRSRTEGYQSPFFNDKFSATGLYNEADGSWKISAIMDRSIIELFLNGGELSATSLCYPTTPLDTLMVRVSGLNQTATASVGVWALKAAWLDQADVNGTVSGNTTHGGVQSRMLGTAKLL
ncbi:SacC Beta-fructosidase levanase invertase [Pyrenophora tritici-repentis]|uniref:Invertase n=2 Tax=Pyrenophora tritici-repentis TaxID=45151 RepID=A0A2W1D6N2_9PLEO|nr:invertase precursor [Pyrenophora tritici-repentis Pt-1C-BFP]KAA8618104.1 invertase [Pyrenophora tritici-repentis]EDU43975.1 invertase precursor [Pyrenophora tritici-repentis Pt-1C-BFP]KAF7442935.1 invertase [Pyrenophora tritici-repentis]KAF7568604.1 SacC, Beta-fructosidase (levanase-invertase) [Pyrenophora tritici-repentis]KAG9376447.1 invertase [Pyrenophora tritici-repentis]